MSIEVIIVEDYDEMSTKSARFLARFIRKKPDLVLGLSTGSTPVGCYEELIRLHKEEGLDFSEVRTFNLDEYVGLPPSHPQSYRSFMEENLFANINIKPENTHLPDGMANDLQSACREYERKIDEVGGVDIQLLGIGINGHIAFNEPGSSFETRTRVVELSEKTRKANARFFDSLEDVPQRAISMGIENIMEAKRIILLASGRRKANAVAYAVEGPVTEDEPASILQKHPNCKFIVDKKSAAKL